jgi:hypothetical protein
MYELFVAILPQMAFLVKDVLDLGTGEHLKRCLPGLSSP